MSKLTDPSQVFLRTLMSLYFTNKVTPTSGEEEAESFACSSPFAPNERDIASYHGTDSPIPSQRA